MACCALWVRPGATPLMLAMLPTVMVVAVTPVAVAPPLPPAGAWLPLAPQAPEPCDTPARAAGVAAPRRRRCRSRRGGTRWTRCCRACRWPGRVRSTSRGPSSWWSCSTSRTWHRPSPLPRWSRSWWTMRSSCPSAQGVELPVPSAWAPVPVPVPELELPECPNAPWASAAWLPVRREPQAEATRARTATDSATARRWRFRMPLISACSSWSVRRDSSRLRKNPLQPVDRAHDGERVAALLFDLAHAPGAAHEHAATDHERDAEQAARDEVGHLLVEVGAVGRAVPAEQDADEAEDDERHADPLEPLAHVAAAAARARPVHHGGQALQARRHRRAAVGLPVGATAGGRHDHGPGQPTDVGRRADLGHLAGVGLVGRPSKDWHQPKPPKSVNSSGVTLKRSMSGSPSEHVVPRASVRSSARLYR